MNALLLSLFLVAGTSGEVEVPRIEQLLVVERLGRGRRSPVPVDPVEAARVRGEWEAPEAGDVVRFEDEEKSWRALERGENGRFPGGGLGGGYAFATVDSPAEQVVLLDARGHRHVYVNGEARGGDLYNNGRTLLPIKLVEGRNELLFRWGRGALGAELKDPGGTVFVQGRDAILPDLIQGEGGELYASVIVTNATLEWVKGWSLVASIAGHDPVASPIPDLPPCSNRKVAVRVNAPVKVVGEKVGIDLDLMDASGAKVGDDGAFPIRVRNPLDKHRRTFVSEIDGTVQEYGVTPAHPEEGDEQPPGLVLTCHGAGVQGVHQASCYSHKSWAHVIGPTNRRDFGFDWEDWGRLDAMEVLAHAEQRFGTDPRRTWVTGHSMGGHGSWILGAQFPDRFAAVAPSAGWIDFWSYVGSTDWEDPTPVEAMLHRASNGSRPRLIERNLLGRGVYVLHGDADNNVPVTQARTMRERLARFHPNWAYYEQPGAGHWWGNRCMDWPPLMEFLRQNVRPLDRDVRRVELWTVDPGVSSRRHWLVIETQQVAYEPTRVVVELEPDERRFTIESENALRIALELDELAEPRTREQKGETVDATVLSAGESLRIVADGEELVLPWPESGRLSLARAGGDWGVAGPLDPANKGPHRSGPFKDAFRHRAILVVGTGGSAEENAWALAKARYDLESFAYRGNGGFDVVLDVDFDPRDDRDRSVILYGNADVNRAWASVVPPDRVDVRRGAVTIGQRRVEGEDLGCLFVQPRLGSSRACVGVVAGTGPVGERTLDQIPYFLAGVGIPDWIVIGAESWSEGSAGVRAAGFFGPDWSVRYGEAGWRE